MDLCWIGMKSTTHAVMYVEAALVPLQQACQPIGVKYSENQTLFKAFQYRLKLNISKCSRFPIPG